MFASVRRYRVEKGSVEDLLRKIENDFVPLIKKSPGNRGHYVVAGPDGTLVSLTGFDDRAGAEESNRLAAGWMRENLGQFRIKTLESTEGEVKVIDRP